MPAPSKTSLIDRVDDRDHPVGYVSRGDVLEAGANFRTVHVLVFHSRKVLLQQLAPTRERHPTQWGSSVAAYLHAGESYEQAAHRRLREELGLESPLTRIGKTRMQDGRSHKFIELFTLLNGPAEIREPDHIAALRYWRLSQLDRDVAEIPSHFTPTFLHVYQYFRQRPPTSTI